MGLAAATVLRLFQTALMDPIGNSVDAYTCPIKRRTISHVIFPNIAAAPRILRAGITWDAWKAVTKEWLLSSI
jgi:hypothetical protein